MPVIDNSNLRINQKYDQCWLFIIESILKHTQDHFWDNVIRRNIRHKIRLWRISLWTIPELTTCKISSSPFIRIFCRVLLWSRKAKDNEILWCVHIKNFNFNRINHTAPVYSDRAVHEQILVPWSLKLQSPKGIYPPIWKYTIFYFGILSIIEPSCCKSKAFLSTNDEWSCILIT